MEVGVNPATWRIRSGEYVEPYLSVRIQRQMTEPGCSQCGKCFSNTSNLRRHERTSKGCLGLQGKLPASEACRGCGKTFSRSDWLRKHLANCPLLGLKSQLEADHADELRKVHEDHLANNQGLRDEIESLQKKLESEYIRGKLDATQEINLSLVGLDIAKSRVKELEKKYLRRRPRVLYPEKFVVYIITNDDLKGRRVYVVGSATSLTHRLSTYNKGSEHEVIDYVPCGSKEKMKVLENMTLMRLSAFREQGNRDRFVLPEDKEVRFFVEILKAGKIFLSS